MPKPRKKIKTLKQMDELDLRKLPDSPREAAKLLHPEDFDLEEDLEEADLSDIMRDLGDK